MNTENEKKFDNNTIENEEFSSAENENLFADLFPEEEASDAPEEFSDTPETELPLYDFAEKPVVKLPDGTECVFSIPSLSVEQRADDLRQTTTIISPVKINGQNPQQDFTDHTKADVAYFLDAAEELRNFAFNEGDQPSNFQAREIARTDKEGDREIKRSYASLVPTKHKRAFVARLYGGKIEVEKAEGKTVPALNAVRRVVVRQELGVETTKEGKTTKPSNIIRYGFKEPNSGHLSRWGRCWNGYTVPVKTKQGMGSRRTSSFKTADVCKLFDDLIDFVEGASFAGQRLDVSNPAHLAGIPAGVKRNMMAIAMQEFTGDVGNE